MGARTLVSALLGTLLCGAAGAAGPAAGLGFAPPGAPLGANRLRAATPALRAPMSRLTMQSKMPPSGFGSEGLGRGFDIPLGKGGGMGGMGGMGGLELPGMPKPKKSVVPEGKEGDPEIILAELAFTNPMELPKIIERNLPYLDKSFFKYLDNKINTTADIEEKETLTLLKECVTDLIKQINAAIAKMSTSVEDQFEVPDELGKAKGGKDLAKSALLENFSDEDMALASYDRLIDEVRSDPEELASSVEAAYDRFDMRFLERLQARIEKAKGADKESLTALNSAIQATMSSRIQKASTALQGVLKAGNPDDMMKQLMILNAKGGLDESVILLMEANIEQAKKAGAEPAIRVLTQLRNKAIDYKDQSMPAEIRLVRQLMRTDDKDARRKLLLDAFEPKDVMYNADGTEKPSQSVNGKLFVQTLRDLIAKYGNIDKKFLDKIDMIAKESEIAARDIFGLEEKDVTTLQQEAFHDRSVSVWDLEALEEAYVNSGQKAPWQGPSRAGWDENGNMVIGGDSYKKGGDDDSKIIW